MPEHERTSAKTYERLKRSLKVLAYAVLDFNDRITPDFSLAYYDPWTKAVYWTTAHRRQIGGETELAVDTAALVSRPIESIPEILTDHYPDDSLICDRQLFEVLRTHPQITVLEENEGSLKIGTSKDILEVFTPTHPLLTNF